MKHAIGLIPATTAARCACLTPTYTCIAQVYCPHPLNTIAQNRQNTPGEWNGMLKNAVDIVALQLHKSHRQGAFQYLVFCEDAGDAGGGSPPLISLSLHGIFVLYG